MELMDKGAFRKRISDFYENKNIYQMIDEMPTIDAVPVKHGRWLEKTVGNFLQSAKCSVCRKTHTTLYEDHFTHYDYCPNCGAKMDEKKVDE